MVTALWFDQNAVAVTVVVDKLFCPAAGREGRILPDVPAKKGKVLIIQRDRFLNRHPAPYVPGCLKPALGL